MRDLVGDIMAVGANKHPAGALRLRLFQRDFSWQALVDFAAAHDVLPALIWSLKRQTLLLPVPRAMSGVAAQSHVTNRLEAAYRQHLDRQANLKDQLVAVIGSLNACGIVPCLLKGARHLVVESGPWTQARGMRDLDILVTSDEVSTATAVLGAAGYRFDQRDLAVSSHHFPEMRREGDFGAIELHTNALAFAGESLLSTAEIWALAEGGEYAGARFVSLPAEWHLLHGLLHHQVSDRGHARRILAFKGLWEFAAQGSEVAQTGWERIVAHMESHGCADILGSWIAQAGRLFKLSLPDGIPISPAAHRHAELTFRRAVKPYWLRRSLFVVDKLRFAFGRETIAHRYRDIEAGSGVAIRLKHVAFLLGKYRGAALQRIFGHRDRPS